MEVDEGDVPTEVVVGGGCHLQAKNDHTQINEVPNVDEVVADSPCAFPSCTSSGQVVEVNASNMSATEIVIEEVMREQKEISEIMYLNEYIGWRGDQSIEDAEVVNTIKNEESTEWANTLQGNLEEGKSGLLDDLSVSRKKMVNGEGKSESLSRKMKYSDGLNEWKAGSSAQSSSYETLWEGILQYNPFVTEIVTCCFQKVWISLLNINSRNVIRGILLISSCWDLSVLGNYFSRSSVSVKFLVWYHPCLNVVL